MKEIPIRYKDFWFRVLVCLAAAHFLVMVGEKVDTLEALTIPSYYPTLAINYAIALFIAFTVRKVTMKLDTIVPWERDVLKRGILQFCLGVVLVALLSFSLVFVYFISFSQDILASTYPSYEFPFSVVLILCLNFFYISYYFYQSRRTEYGQGSRTTTMEMETDRNENSSIEHPVYSLFSSTIKDEALKESPLINKREKKEILIIDTPTRSIPIKLCDLAFAFVSSGTTFVFLKGMNRLQDAFIMSSPLKELEDALDPVQFYRINRKCIVNFDAISAFKAGQERSLMLILEPDLMQWTGMEKQELTKLCTVSADRVAPFKRWIDR
ncbi:LytTr DNA-binding domain protein [compost metagenome]